MSENNIYDEDSIQSLERLDYVRKRPTLLVPDTEAAGITQLAKELIDNSIDELAEVLRSTNRLAEIVVTLCRDIARGSFQLIVRDTGRGVPLGKLVDVFTKTMTSGKFNQNAYIASSGSFGQGAKATAGLSAYFRVMSYRPDGVGSLLVQSGIHPLEATIVPPINGMSGSIVSFEPDLTLFTGVAEYADINYVRLLDLLKKYVFFSDYKIEFRISEQPMPAEYWTSDINSATLTCQTTETQAALVWSSVTHNRIEWIRHYWHITRPFAWEWKTQKSTPPLEYLKDFHLQLFYVKTEQKGDAFGMVNNISIDAPSSNHISIVLEQVTAALAPRITDKVLRKFFIDSYRLPLFIAVDVKYSGAEFGNSTKQSFISAPFREAYRAELLPLLTSPQASAALDQLYQLIQDDIQTHYMQSLSSLGKTKLNMNRISLGLIRDDKFKDCTTKNRAIAELFLVEGKSAGGAVGHNTETQATYQLSGKPKNVMTDARDHKEMLRLFLKNDIYTDVCKIINFDPLKPNLDNLNFGRCFFMADGDPHGGHIAALLIGAFEVAAPMLIRSGFFGIVAPPYYEVWTGRRKVNSTYVRDQSDLIQWKAINIYDHQIHIDVEYTSNLGQAQVRLDQQQLILFATKIAEIGIAIENLSNEFSLPGLLVEALTRVTYYLTPQTMNTEFIKQQTGAHRVEYDKAINTLIISIGREDYVIPLFDVAERICSQVSHILQTIKWRNWVIFITSKRNSELVNCPVSIYQLYELMKMMDKMITVKTLKGIGSMDASDAARTCMNVRNRRVYQITHPGDVERIYTLLGNDSQSRKDLSKTPPITDYQHMHI